MVSTRPYLVRAIYDWAVDNSFTPFLLIDTSAEGVVIPEQFAKDNSLVLNVAPTAVKDLNLGDEYISFSARFDGVSQELFIPINGVRAVYAKENGEGIVIPPEAEGMPVISGVPAPAEQTTAEQNSDGPKQKSADSQSSDDKEPGKKKPHLTIVE
ncbi:MAG: ClpXP protease specificity-enhancing factor [Pseudomonadota bacterium]